MMPWTDDRLGEAVASVAAAAEQRRTALARQRRREAPAAVQPAEVAWEDEVNPWGAYLVAQEAAEPAVAEEAAEPAAAAAQPVQPEPSVEELLRQYLRRLRRVERVVFPAPGVRATVVELAVQLHARQDRLRGAQEVQLREINLVARRVRQIQADLEHATGRWQRRADGFGLRLQALEGRLNALERRIPPAPPRPAVAAEEGGARPPEWDPPPGHEDLL